MRYKIGMYGGSFNPLHLGHVNTIINAANQCEKLYVVLSVTNDAKEIDRLVGEYSYDELKNKMIEVGIINEKDN